MKRTTPAHRIVRIALLLGLAWLGLNTASSIKTLLSPPPTSTIQRPTIDHSAIMLPTEGAWRFDDSLATVTTSQTKSPSIAPASELAINEPTLKAFLKTDDNAEVATATLAMKTGDQWQVLKLGESKPNQTTPHLLPLDTSKRVCGRWSADNRLLLEIVSVDAKRHDLLNKWREDGWEIRHTRWGGLDSFSFLCVKGGHVVYAWSQQHEQITSLLLSSSPDVALRQAKSNHGENS